ncbi:MAG: glycosyltransferase, partial [Promethearchaeati archaeon]
QKLTIRLIRINRNLYFGPGCNKGIKNARGDYICLLNYDTIVSSNFIEEMVKFLDNNPDAGMITPKIKINNDRRFIWNAGGFLNFRSPIVVLNRGLLEYDPLDKKYNETEKIDFAPGTALFVRKEVIEKIGLIDEIYLMYHEDPDWNLRAQKEGFVSYYVPKTIVFHRHSIDLKDDIKMLFWWDSDWRKSIKSKKILLHETPFTINLNSIKKKREISKNLFNDHFFKRNSQILVWKFGSFIDLLIFYFNYLKLVFLIILFNRRKIQINRLLYAIRQGFIIGVKKRTNRSCIKMLKKEYIYVRNLQYVEEKQERNQTI